MGSDFSPQPATAMAAAAAVPSKSGLSRSLRASSTELTARQGSEGPGSAKFDLDEGTARDPLVE